ncbi:Teichuronic acid biosynthesis protein TuaE [Bacillus sp. LL01]|uniref:teichuronic acid biosynthesis protein TuaE n=1 Tax=Bacillus sp. LL01 TaxID=1665556 RepID=UPI00064D4DB6|nr:O-antigen ligase family protein [Bacillus sp. LL01]KMJ59014.1 Teichuronic acid biosynthesis protein TuaE [Bacillus sp. LL01]
MNLGFAGIRQVVIGVGGLLLGAILTAGFIFIDKPNIYIPLVLFNFALLILVILKEYLFDSRFLLVSIYVLLGLTFLNNAFFAINLGFFSLFPYRILLIIVGFLIVFNLIRSEFRKDLWLQWERIKVKGMLLFFVFWIYYALLTLLWAKSVTNGIKYISILVMGIFLMFIVTLFINNLKRLMNFYYIWVFMSVFVMLIGYWNAFTKNHLPSSTLYLGPEYKQHYPTSVFTNQNDFATFLSVSLFFFLSLIRNGKNNYWKAIGVVLSLVAIHLILLSESRASQLAVVVGIGVYVFILCNKKLKRWILGLGAAGAALFVAVFYNKLWTTFSTLFMSPTIHDFSERLPSNVGRANLIRNAFNFSLDSFGMGVGAGNTEYYMRNYSIHDTDEVANVHFWFLEIFTNFGIFVLLGYLTLYAYLLFKLYKHHENGLTNQYKLVTEAILVALAAFVVSSISPSSVSNLFFHWVLLAFGIASLNILRIKGREEKVILSNHNL